MYKVEMFALPGIPEVVPGNDVGEIILSAALAAGENFHDGDTIVIAQKIVSKAEGRYAVLDDVTPSEEAIQLGRSCDKHPGLAQLILDESKEVVRVRPGVVIVEHNNGYVHANAGIDRSNLPSTQKERVLLLPLDPDQSALDIKETIKAATGTSVNVIINDSAGRAWRNGTMGFAIGTAGFEPLVDMIGKKDMHGRAMEVTQVAVADELAASASFMMGQADEATPVVIIRGARLISSNNGSKALIREKSMDMFR